MDFIMDLPPSNSFDSILVVVVVVDCFAKITHLIPCNKSIIDEKITKLFLDHVFHYHEHIENIVYDCGA
jgi:hypothetical protein